MLLLAFMAATFVGNEACQPCHSDLYKSYISSPMARSSGKVLDTPEGQFRRLRIDTTGSAHWDAFQRKLDYFIGSGAHGRSYIVVRDGFLYQAPFTWYTQKQRWDASPGYEHDRSLRWSRPIEPNCLWCHASSTRPIYGTQNRYADPPFTQDGVSCERCHGPGSEHIAGKSGMVNPALLEPARRDAVCAQCHLSGEARIDKAKKSIAMYRPGELLSDYVTYFTAGQGAMKATSHYEKLSVSACKTASGDKLWCGTCHSPHRDVSTRTACLSCHQANCGRGADCASCHMPKRRVADGGHGVLTDHSIPRKPGKSGSIVSQQLEPWPGFEAGVRELGLAYAETGLQPRKALGLLSSAPPDAAVLLRIAWLHEQSGDYDRAAESYRRALLLQPAAVFALVNLGSIEARAGRYAEAISLWQRALAANPGQLEAAKNLIALLRSLHRPLEADRVADAMRYFEP